MSNEKIVCLKCGRHLRTLTRHINAAHGLTPQAYKAKWALPEHTLMQALDLELVHRSTAKNNGLANKGLHAQRIKREEAEKAGRINRNKRHDQKVSYDLLRRMVRLGVSVDRVASHYGISRMTVYNAMRWTEK